MREHGQGNEPQESGQTHSAGHNHFYVQKVSRPVPGAAGRKNRDFSYPHESLISSIEAAGIAKSFSLEVFYNIADALEIEPATLLSAPTQFDNLLKQNT